MKKIAIIFITLVCIGSCRCPKILANTQTVRDTITIEKKTIERDTVFYTPKSEVKVQIPLADLCNKLDTKTIRKEDGNAVLNVWRSNGMNAVASPHSAEENTEYLYITAECDSIALAAKIKEHFNNTRQVKEIVKTQTVERKYVPFWVKFFAWVGGISIVAALFILITKKIIK